MNEKDRIALADAPFIAWVDYGLDGWHPWPYDTLAEAVAHEAYGSYKVITKRCQYEIAEKP